jgi:aminoglycoside 3-N-acetyltransferase
VPWYMCSYLHRVEWNVRVPYRYLKTFKGEMVRDGKREPLTETLFVRSLEPSAENVWPGLDGYLAAGGMRSLSLGRGQLAETGARSLVESLVPVARRDPFAFVKNPEVLRAHFAPQGA